MKNEQFRWVWLGYLLLVLAFTCAGCSRSATPKADRSPMDLASLLKSFTNTLRGTDIARMNLLCAQGLPGCETVDVANSLALLDQWAARVRSETGNTEAATMAFHMAATLAPDVESYQLMAARGRNSKTGRNPEGQPKAGGV